MGPTVWIFTDERIDLRGGCLRSRTAVTGAFLDVIRAPSSTVVIVCRPAGTEATFEVDVPESTRVLHTADWSRLGFIGALMSLRRPVSDSLTRDGDTVIAVMPTVTGLTVGLSALLRGSARRVITLNRGFLSDSLLLRLPSWLRLPARVPLFLTGRAMGLVNRRSARPLYVSRALADAVSAPPNHAICPEIDWRELAAASETVHEDREGVLFVGRLEVEKNPRFAAQVVEKLPGTRLTFVGAGSELERLQEYCAARQIDATFLGPVPHEEVLRLMSRAEAVIIPSHTEAFGLVAFEAAALGCAVVHSGAGGLAEAAAESPTVRQVATWDAELWADALTEAMKANNVQPSAGQSLSSAAAGWVRLPEVIAHGGSGVGS